MSTKRKRETAEEIVERGLSLGYSDIRVIRGGKGVEWGMPMHDRNASWEAIVRRRVNDVIAYLRKRDKARKAEERADAAQSKREKSESATLRSIAAEIESLRCRVESLEKSMLGDVDVKR